MQLVVYVLGLQFSIK